ncbi:HlyD family efflux transporter periplasmic adaptor subunit [Candidatus Gottesmanbacteria bacterium]|nr:HlyD family efflux transporter periplasmic adaptor subunit [Candidatus Gottesmanbacteria bacterium]
MKSVAKILARVKRALNKTKKTVSARKKRIVAYIDKKPYKSFFIALGLLLILIVLSNILGVPKVDDKKGELPPKQVEIYAVGTAPKLTVQAQIEKSGVVHITSLTSGVVQSIGKGAGQKFSKGQILVRLSTNYQGGNASSLARQMAQIQYQNVVDTYDVNKEIIKKQKELAEKGDAQADDLRTITDKSISETQSLINLNSDILTTLDKNLSNLEATNVSGSNDGLILSTKQLKSQFLAANNSARQALRMSEFNSSADNPPAQISDVQKEISLKQLGLQEKMLDLSREVSKIQLQIARVSEGMMFPTAPFNGTVQKVFVKVGQQVNPGTELMVLSQTKDKDPAVATAYVSSDIAKKVSKLEPSKLHINSTASIDSFPSFVTQDAISGSLYGVYFTIPDEYVSEVVERGFIQVDLPIGYIDTGASVPFIPIDAIYQTKDQNYVFVAVDGKAGAKSIELGHVFGSFVEILSGLENGDKVITNRNVIAGDSVVTK